MASKRRLLCGKAASGKSCLARELAEAPGTVMLAEEQWLAELFPWGISNPDDYQLYARRVRKVIGPHVVGLLRALTRGVIAPDEHHVHVATLAELGADVDQLRGHGRVERPARQVDRDDTALGGHLHLPLGHVNPRTASSSAASADGSPALTSGRGGNGRVVQSSGRLRLGADNAGGARMRSLKQASS